MKVKRAERSWSWPFFTASLQKPTAQERRPGLHKLIQQAPTGMIDPPQPVQAGGKTFYYYGPGGGVCYADRYFFNLRGKTLTVDFAGPCTNDKTPTEETKALEPVVLASLRVF